MYLRRRRRRRALGVRRNDGSPAAGARERREARGIGREICVAAIDGLQSWLAGKHISRAAALPHFPRAGK